jgi:hypothetical protein
MAQGFALPTPEPESEIVIEVPLCDAALQACDIQMTLLSVDRPMLVGLGHFFKQLVLGCE